MNRAGRVVVVGGGPAAAALVHGLDRGGHEGEVVVLGAEPDGPYDRTAVSKSMLAGDGAAPPALFPDVVGPLRRHAVVEAIDRPGHEVVLATGERVPYDTLVLATGAAPWVPPVPGLDGPGTSTLRDAGEAAALAGKLGTGARLLVVGAGLIGLEVAAAARARGTSVSVLEAADRPMARVLPSAIAQVLLDRHAEAGVEVRTGCPPVGVAGSDGRVEVTLADGATLAADHVLVATGVRPRTALAEAAGLAVDDGVLVGELLLTDDPAVMAIGDCARVRCADGTSTRTEAYTPAMAMGQHAARTLLGDPAPYRDVPWAWTDQHDLTAQVAGWPGAAQRWVPRGSVADLEAGLFAFGVAEDRLVAVAGVSRGRQVGRVVRAAQALVGQPVGVEGGLTEAVLADPTTDLRAVGRALRSPSPANSR